MIIRLSRYYRLKLMTIYSVSKLFDLVFSYNDLYITFHELSNYVIHLVKKSITQWGNRDFLGYYFSIESWNYNEEYAHLIYCFVRLSVGYASKDTNLIFLRFRDFFKCLKICLPFFSLLWQLNICSITYFVRLSVLWVLCFVVILVLILRYLRV